MNNIQRSPLILSALALLTSISVSNGQTFNLDGYMTDPDSYTNKAAIGFFNGHEPEAYGSENNPTYETFLHWGQGKLSGAAVNSPDYFFVYVETPIEVKNMIWGDAVTAADLAEYTVQWSNHHGGSLSSLDYGQATGSEHVKFIDSSGNEKLKTDLQPGSASGGFGLLDVKTSVDYLFDNGFADGNSSDNRDIGMAFEYQFALDTAKNNEFLDVLRDGGVIEYHLSPERGLVPTQVPEPSSTLLLGLSSIACLLRRKR